MSGRPAAALLERAKLTLAGHGFLLTGTPLALLLIFAGLVVHAKVRIRRAMSGRVAA